MIPSDAKEYFSNLSMEKTIAHIINPNDELGNILGESRNDLLGGTFLESIDELRSKFGDEIDNWHYGQPDQKHIQLKHALDPLLTDEEKGIFNTTVVPRGGYSYTLNNTSGNNNQTHGASFRIIVDTGNFEEALGCNSPGQSGDPRDPHYKDLYDLWANEEYFPVYYTREKIEENMDRVIVLKPSK